MGRRLSVIMISVMARSLEWLKMEKSRCLK